MSQYKTATFSKKDLQDMLWEDGSPLTVVSDDIVDNTRWGIVHDLVFKDQDGVFYQTGYQVGATEYQDERPFENEGDEITVNVVEPVEVTVIKYKRVSLN